MPSSHHRGWNRNRLRWALGLFFLALALPTVILTWQAYSRLEWENIHRYQLQAEEMVARVNERLSQLITKEERRSVADYRFLVVAGTASANILQPSPLSGYPVQTDLPGLLGYFQIDAAGDFTTPLLPDDGPEVAQNHGVTATELSQRRILRDHMLRILTATQHRPAERDREARRPPAAQADSITLEQELDDETARASDQAGRYRSMEQQLGQAAFQRLSKTSVDRSEEKQLAALLPESLKLAAPSPQTAAESKVQTGKAKRDSGSGQAKSLPRAARKERNLAPIQTSRSLAEQQEPVPGVTVTTRVRIFESEIDPLEFDHLKSGHFVLYRKVWRDKQRYVQGALIEQRPFLRALIERPFLATGLAAVSRLTLAYNGQPLYTTADEGDSGASYRSEQLSGTSLYRGRLALPLSRLEVNLAVTRLPTGPGATLIAWTALVLGVVLCGGLFSLYRVGVKQIELYRQQQDFVSAVSHELKTPLTSIRMYSEMLREEWADERRKADYYAFIHDESERLSRLIENILQLARLSRNELRVEPRPLRVETLTNMLHTRLSSLIEQNGFQVEYRFDPSAAAVDVELDEDAFLQIVINLVDNAIKFSAKASRKSIVIASRRLVGGKIQFSVRDQGPGIPPDQMKKIFRMFYRSGSELTRETVGTGIGLALVQRLTNAMGGQIDVVNHQPGAEFKLVFPVVTVGQ